MQNDNNRKRKAETQIEADFGKMRHLEFEPLVVNLRSANNSLVNEPICTAREPSVMAIESFLVREEFSLFDAYMAIRPAHGGPMDQA